MKTTWISHRGESMDAPENTLASFKLSQERHTDGMECDVHLTSDGQVVVAHDGCTARMGDQNCFIADTPWEKLKKINVSGAFEQYPDEHIPLLTDTFKYLGSDRQFYIELKPGCAELVPEVAAILKSYNFPPEQIVIISFDGEMIALSKKLQPQYKTLWLRSISPEMQLEELIKQLQEIQADGIDAAADENVLTPEYIAKLHDAGMFVAIWTVDQPAQAQRFIASGVDSITSNRAAKLRDLLENK